MLKSTCNKQYRVEKQKKVCYNQIEGSERGVNMNKKTVEKILFIFTLILVLTTIFTIKSLANSDLVDPSDYKPNTSKSDAYGKNTGDSAKIYEIGAKVVKILRNVSAAIAVLTITIVGFRYMLGSVEQRAEYKETMKPIIIGCILIAGLSSILSVIEAMFL